mmetsp:Transcript_9531/g.14683  ORF Transcript_9531/g.14683 Transcript_9531/m.14683 type:complete len:96 (-) Transcript_9531:124-411(-)
MAALLGVRGEFHALVERSAKVCSAIQQQLEGPLGPARGMLPSSWVLSNLAWTTVQLMDGAWAWFLAQVLGKDYYAGGDSVFFVPLDRYQGGEAQQ